MSISERERSLLRDLAKQVSEIAAHPENQKKREWWIRHNRLEKVKPMVLVFPEGAWAEMLPYDVLQCEDEWCRHWEWWFRHIIYRWNYLRDDNVIDNQLEVHAAIRFSDWGLTPGAIHSDTPRGAWAFDPPLKDPDDIKLLKPLTFTCDPKATKDNYDRVTDMFGDFFPVRVVNTTRIDLSIIGMLARLRGLDQIMIDMLDRPEWLHKVMSFMTDSTLKLLDDLEEADLLSLNNGCIYVGSGGVALTDELPAPDFDGTHVRTKDMWGSAEAQELALVSPAMHEEFALQYQIKLLERFGLSYYGCCESLTDKLKIVKKIPNLRRVSVSPWTDVHVAAEELQDKYIYCWKPNPSVLVGHFDEDRIRNYIAETLDAAKDCVLEITMKDNHTVDNEPHRMTRWVEIAQEMTG